jgi:hypothetical protein
MRALVAVLLLGVGAGAAPLPREREPDLVGVWAYSWNGTPGVMVLGADGSYCAWHGIADPDCGPNYAGCWWRSKCGRVVLCEYRANEHGQCGPANRFEFVTESRGGTVLLSGYSRVALTRYTEGVR